MEIKKRPSEVNAFNLIGKLAGEATAKAILATVRGLPFARLYCRGVTTGNSTAIFTYLDGLSQADIPPLTYCETSDFVLRHLNSLGRLLRPEDTIESMVFPFSSDDNETRELIVSVGKDVPVQEDYEDFTIVRMIGGKTFELDVYGPEVFDVLSRRAKGATEKKGGKAS